MTELNLIMDHVSLSVEDLERAKNFYSKALAPLGMGVVGEVTAEQSGSVALVGFGIGRGLLLGGAQRPADTDVRTEYHDSYYSAFVLSPEGHNIEAVCFEDQC